MAEKQYEGWCKHCFNPVRRIQYRKNRHGEVSQIGRGKGHVWVHDKRGGTKNKVLCSKSPLLDEDVSDEKQGDFFDDIFSSI